MAIQTLSDAASGWPYISLLILKFLNCCIPVKTNLINTKLGNLENLSVLFLTTCGSINAYPIINRLVPSSTRFKIRQCITDSFDTNYNAKIHVKKQQFSLKMVDFKIHPQRNEPTCKELGNLLGQG